MEVVLDDADVVVAQFIRKLHQVETLREVTVGRLLPVVDIREEIDSDLDHRDRPPSEYRLGEYPRRSGPIRPDRSPKIDIIEFLILAGRYR
jgi:hypothetical protein